MLRLTIFISVIVEQNIQCTAITMKLLHIAIRCLRRTVLLVALARSFLHYLDLFNGAKQSKLNLKIGLKRTSVTWQASSSS